MKRFKEIMFRINTTFSIILFCYALERVSCGDYQSSTILLAITLDLFILGYLAERYYKEK